MCSSLSLSLSAFDSLIRHANNQKPDVQVIKCYMEIYAWPVQPIDAYNLFLNIFHQYTNTRTKPAVWNLFHLECLANQNVHVINGANVLGYHIETAVFVDLKSVEKEKTEIENSLIK